MINIQNYGEIYDKNNTIVLGGFETIHLGHQRLLEMANKQNREFSMMRINFGNQILTNNEIKMLARQNGWKLTNILSLRFSDIKNVTYIEFIEFLKSCKIKNIVCGEDFKFGKNAEGSIDILKQHFNVDVVDLKKIDGEKISTYNIKKKLDALDFNYFYRTHGYDYFIFSKIVHGDKIGRTIDFPTINSDVNNKRMLPNGVYVSNVLIDGIEYLGATYFGTRPSVSGMEQRIETFIYDFDDEIYGKMVQIKILSQTRGQMKFASLDDLKMQIKKDVENVKRWWNNKK